MNAIHLVDDTLSAATPYLYAAMMMAMLVAMIGRTIYTWTKDPIRKVKNFRLFKSGAMILLGIISIIAVCTIPIEMQAWAEITPKLNAGVDNVTADDKPVAQAADLVSVLKAMDTSPFRYGHTHPTRHIAITLNTKNGPLDMELTRDSGNPHIYWIFYPSYKATSKRDIGKITTSALDNN